MNKYIVGFIVLIIGSWACGMTNGESAPASPVAPRPRSFSESEVAQRLVDWQPHLPPLRRMPAVMDLTGTESQTPTPNEVILHEVDQHHGNLIEIRLDLGVQPQDAPPAPQRVLPLARDVFRLANVIEYVHELILLRQEEEILERYFYEVCPSRRWRLPFHRSSRQ